MGVLAGVDWKGFLLGSKLTLKKSQRKKQLMLKTYADVGRRSPNGAFYEVSVNEEDQKLEDLGRRLSSHGESMQRLGAHYSHTLVDYLQEK